MCNAYTQIAIIKELYDTMFNDGAESVPIICFGSYPVVISYMHISAEHQFNF